MLLYASTWLGMILTRLFSNRRSQSYLYPVLFVFLIVFAGLRWEVGCDWRNYLRHYEVVSIPDFSPWNMPIEQGWWFLIDTIEGLGFPYFVVNLVVAAIFFSCIHQFAKRQNDPFAFLIILFPMLILGMVMAAIRQAVAIGFVTLALMAFADRAPKRMTLWILLASSFHVSALVFSPLIALSWGRLNMARISVSLVLALPIAALVVFSESADNATDSYVGTEIVARGALIRVGSLLSTAVLFWFFLRKSFRTYSPEDYSIAILFTFASFALLAIMGQSSVIADRLSYYLVPLQAMVIVRAQVLPGIQNRQFLLAAQWLVLTVALITWMTVSTHFRGCYVPYQNLLLGTSV